MDIFTRGSYLCKKLVGVKEGEDICSKGAYGIYNVHLEAADIASLRPLLLDNTGI